MRRAFPILFFFFVLSQAGAQGGYVFRHLGAAEGLADGVVRAIGQDKYGYIWVSTLSGLNRFDGYGVKTFYNDPTDSTSLPPSVVRSIFSDRDGRLWFGFDRGFALFDHHTGAFLSLAGVDFYVTRIAQLPSGLLLLNTGKGIQLFDPVKRKFSRLLFPDRSQVWAYTFFVHGSRVYLASHLGVWLYDAAGNSMRCLRKEEATAVARDGEGKVWFVSNGGKLLNQTDEQFRSTKTWTEFATSPTGTADGSVNDLFVDRRGELWGLTNVNGLIRFNRVNGFFERCLNDPARPTSLSSNLVSQIFQSAEGYIWAGTEGWGLNYFHPERKLFSQLAFPAEWSTRMTSYWMRSLVVDKEGDYWVGAGGVLHFAPDGKPLHFFNNRAGQSPQLHSNSVRSLLCDEEGNVWIGTSAGVNKYQASTGRLLFLDAKDSLPRSFYWALLQDRDGTIWFGERDNLHYKKRGEDTVRNIGSHPLLQRLKNRGIRSLYEDSKGRLWFATNGSGLVMWDKRADTVAQWTRSKGRDTVLLNDYIVDITEDKAGEMWFSSFTGLTAYNPVTKKFRWYTQANGLPSIKTSALMVDDKNRIWIGSTKGLLLLDSTIKGITSFGTSDGLPSMEFSDMKGTKLPDGRFAMPTLNGMLLFDPLAYEPEKSALRFWLSSVQYLGRNVPLSNPEEAKALDLHWNENFFTFKLTAVHYSNPDAVWYAYKLDGFDDDWNYTKDRVANYTNVPGGNYTFRYKATTNPENWNVAEKTVRLHVGTVFYKAVWFWVLVGLLVLTAVYSWYTARERQQRRIFRLQTKAQALEKEKAMVMYENLKQQLNPHFLFNSLTSLGSLIRFDQKLASRFLDGMSKTYRYILKSRDNEVVPLGEEVAFAETYVALQKTRFEEGLQVRIDVPEEERYKRIVPVTLQNLVENAIKHNVIDAESPLVIELFTEDNYLVARNNLQRKNFVETSNKQGLANMRSLYTYITGRPIVIDESDGHFTVKIPLV